MKPSKILIHTAALAGAFADEFVRSGKEFSCAPAGEDVFLFVVWEKGVN